MDNRIILIRKVVLTMIGFDDWLIKKILGNLLTKAIRKKAESKDIHLNFDSIRVERLENDQVLIHADVDLSIKDKDVLKLLSLDEQ